MTNCGWMVTVDVETDCTLMVAVDWTNVEAIGSNDAVVWRSDAEDEAVCSTSIRGAGGSGVLNSGFGGFFKLSMPF
uniref:Uncharacterized protein n=1 Tax=Romanomermis culicivorax TaxID=13658 RepID=A0A915KM71_ROMCU